MFFIELKKYMLLLDACTDQLFWLIGLSGLGLQYSSNKPIN